MKTYEDLGVSGAKPPTRKERPQLWAMIRDAGKATFEIALVVNFDRVSRDVADAAWIRKEFERSGVRLAETSSPELDSRSPSGKLMYGIKATMAEFERGLLIERTKRGMAQLKEEGRWAGRVPHGFAIGEDGKLALDDRGRKVRAMVLKNPRVTAKIVQRQLGIAKYKEAWNLLASVKAHGRLSATTPQSGVEYPTPSVPLAPSPKLGEGNLPQN